MSAPKIGPANRFFLPFFVGRRAEPELSPHPLAELDHSPRAPDHLRLKEPVPRSTAEIRASIDRFLAAPSATGSLEEAALFQLLQDQRGLLGHYFGH
jgi:hypothetical protein